MLNTDMVMVPREILKRSMDLLGCVGCSPEGAESDARDAARLQEDIKPYVAAPPAAPAPAAKDAEIAALRAEVAGLRELLEVAQQGLLWYQDTYPDAVNECDHEVMAQIAAVTAAKPATSATTSVPHSEKLND